MVRPEAVPDLGCKSRPGRYRSADLHIPEPFTGLIQTLIRDGRLRRRRLVGHRPMAAPGLQPGRPLTAARLGARLRKHGIRAQPGRRSALTHLAAQLPAAVLADLLGITPPPPSTGSTTAAGDWNPFAAQIAHTSKHQP